MLPAPITSYPYHVFAAAAAIKAMDGPTPTTASSRRASLHRTSQTTSNVVTGVAISKPEKLMWPDDGDDHPVTKVDLARYYEAVGPWMIAHLKGRPCSRGRCPGFDAFAVGPV